MLAMFDFPDPNVHSARRSLTTTPLQKMFVLNNPFMIQLAESLAARLMALKIDKGDVTSQRIEQAHQWLYSRSATETELRLGRAFLGQGDNQERWQQYAHVLLASNEMLYLD